MDAEEEVPSLDSVADSSANFERASSPVSSASSKRPSLTAGFYKSSKSEELRKREGCVHWLEIALFSIYTDIFMIFIVVIDVVLCCYDIDTRAAGLRTPEWAEIAGLCCLCLYTLQFGLALMLQGFASLKKADSIVDAAIILVGFLELALTAAGIEFGEASLVRVLRMLRVTRLFRVVQKSQLLKELRKLVTMIGSCFITLTWSFLFLFIIMTCWSMLAVEIVHPVVQELFDEGVFADCDYCQRAFSTIMMSNLTAFKTIITGDGWGTIAIPVIERCWPAAVILCGSFVSMVFGVLHLVVIVVVDTAAEQRHKDMLFMALDMDNEMDQDLKVLTKMFQKIDADGSGELDLEELRNGAFNCPEFRNRLRVMDIDESDLEQFFNMLDADGGGSISPDEFNLAISRWMQESRTAVRFVKYTVMAMQHEQALQSQALQDLAETLQQLRWPSCPEVSDGKVAATAPASSMKDEHPSSRDLTVLQDILQNQEWAVDCEAAQISFDKAVHEIRHVMKNLQHVQIAGSSSQQGPEEVKHKPGNASSSCNGFQSEGLSDTEKHGTGTATCSPCKSIDQNSFGPILKHSMMPKDPSPSGGAPSPRMIWT